MKKFLGVLFFLSCSCLGQAQCDKKVSFTSTRTEYLDGAMNVQRSVDEKTVILLDSTGISITPGSEENRMTGDVKPVSCSWTIPYREGKTSFKATVTNPGGQEIHLTITIEGKDGKVILLAEVDEHPDMKIRVTADKFEEQRS